MEFPLQWSAGLSLNIPSSNGILIMQKAQQYFHLLPPCEEESFHICLGCLGLLHFQCRPGQDTQLHHPWWGSKLDVRMSCQSHLYGYLVRGSFRRRERSNHESLLCKLLQALLYSCFYFELYLFIFCFNFR